MLKITSGLGNKAAFKILKRTARNTKRGIQKAHLQMKNELKKTADEGMAEPKSGRTYKVYVGRGGKRLRRPRLHRASAHGEMPAILTGALKKSLGFELKNGSILTFGANTPYARRHELKGQRSYLLKSIRKNRRNNINWYEKEIEKAIWKG